MTALDGVRGRVTAAVLAITAVLYSVLGAVGFVAIANAARDDATERVERELDAFEALVRSGSSTVSARTADGVVVRVVRPGAQVDEAAGELLVERPIGVEGTELVLVGSAQDPSSTTSLRSLYWLLWIGIPIASVTSALLAGMATKQALRPVDAMTEIAATIGHDARGGRVPVPDTGDEIERLGSTMNAMLDRIEEVQLRQRRFTSDAAHELRTPLMALQGEIELATPQLAGVDTELPDRLAALCERLQVRIDDLLLLAMLDEAPTLDLGAVRLRDVISAEADDVGADVGWGDDDLLVAADPALLARAVRNLLSNARRHAVERVMASTERVEGRVWVHVDDDGPGIDAADRDRVFERFTRLDESRTLDRGGAGLGLAIAASVAAAHGGGVAATDSPLGGARLSMWFPARD